MSNAKQKSDSATQQRLVSPPDAAGRKVVLIDGHALAFRSYYAIRDLGNSKGESTNAVFGFVRSLLRILDEEGEYDATVVTFDAPEKTFRHEQYEDYKAGRKPIPEDLPQQLQQIRRLVEYLGLHSLEVPGLEADDLIGTVATRCAERGYRVEIVTSDRDAYQLISDRIVVRGLTKADEFGPEEVFEKYGVRVAQWVDYRALTGDSSDNIPGAKGIGPKKAQRLLSRYGTLDYILEHLDEVEPVNDAKKIREHIDAVKFSRELSTIVTDADLEIDPESWAQREMDEEGLRELLGALEFGSVLSDLGLEPTPAHTEYRFIRWADTFFGGSLGYRLSGQSPLTSDLGALALAQAGTVSVAPSEAHTEFFETAERLNACDAKALAVYAKHHGYDCDPGDDPLLMAYVLDPNVSDPETVARRYDVGTWEDDVAVRATITAELLSILPGEMNDKQRALYKETEQPLAGVLAEMERHGVRLDVDLLQQQSADLAARLDTIETRVRGIADNPDLNLNSRDQLATLLYDKLGLSPGKKTSTGKRSTAVSALEPLVDDHEVVGLILDYRELAKLKSTYLDPLPKLVHPETGRVHTTFNQAVVATGRLSSTNPNLQNIPVRSDVGRKIRRAFIADGGHQLLVADYSQIELRILAHVSGEEALIASFQEGEDIHRRTAAQIYDAEPEDVTAEMRRVAKIINFGVLYGMSAHRLTRELSIDYGEAKSFIDAYFARYPKVQRYIDDTLDFARNKGYVETLFGRRRPIPDITTKNRNAREYAERTAYNMPIQGAAADIMKKAMVALAPELTPHHARLLLQVHDELVVEVPDDAVEAVTELTRDTMQSAFEMAVPLVAEVGIGPNWLDAKA